MTHDRVGVHQWPVIRKRDVASQRKQLDLLLPP